MSRIPTTIFKWLLRVNSIINKAHSVSVTCPITNFSGEARRDPVFGMLTKSWVVAYKTRPPKISCLTQSLQSKVTCPHMHNVTQVTSPLLLHTTVFVSDLKFIHHVLQRWLLSQHLEEVMELGRVDIELISNRAE